MRQSIKLELATEDDTVKMANALAIKLVAPLVIVCKGEIGAGKTTFIRALLRALGVVGPIKSPTFSLVESYVCDAFNLHHFDLYRIHDEMELDFIGFRDYFESDSICCIEWPERAGSALWQTDLSLVWSVKGVGRDVEVCAHSAIGAQLVSSLDLLYNL